MNAAVTPLDLRAAMSQFTTGVTIMTTSGGVRHGMTANSLTCVSLDPPLILVCVNNQARILQALRSNGLFTLSILARDQRDLARYFANPKRALGAGEFEGTGWTVGDSGVPRVEDALAWLDCRVSSVEIAGDHHIVIGEVLDLTVGSGDPLVFFRGQFED